MLTKYWPQGSTCAALAAYLMTTTAVQPVKAEDAGERLDEVSVTATRAERSTKDVPSSITVISSDRIEGENMFNIKDGLRGTPGVQINSKNGGFDSRLIIRGAGQKATYGVREIMVLRDGVPMSDPDSFTRFDFIDTQDIQQIEVTKGPGSIYGGGSAGGVIQILSKSVFEEENRVRIGLGTSGTSNVHARYSSMVSDNDAIAVTVSRRAMDNEWRRWNKFESTQGSIKHGHMFENGGVWETELSVSEVNMQLPGAMDQDQFSSFRDTGKQTGNDSAWDYSGRDSNGVFFNSKYELEDGNFTYLPRVYFTRWGHYHPVTGAINVSPENYVFGGDGEVHYKHELFGASELVAGVSARMDRTIDARKYTYLDATFNAFSGRLTSVNSDRVGDLMETENATHTQLGFFVQETVRPYANTMIDASFRYDRSDLDIITNEMVEYSWATAKWQPGDGVTRTKKGFDLISARLGGNYALNKDVNLYASLATSDQVPSNSEVESNTSLNQSTTRTVEFGAKGRQSRLRYDAAVYYSQVIDEIVSVSENGNTTFQNAGEVEKKGFELAANYDLDDHFTLGLNYAFSDFIFKEFNEPINGTNFDRSGNRMPLIPTQQTALSLNYDSGWGLKGGISTETWSGYQKDNANTEDDDGYKFITNANLRYNLSDDTSFALNIDNLFDRKYAVEAKKDTGGENDYAAGQPRSFVVSFRHKF